ncbi:TetR/AcrR family transcriptional regulator [Gorillibacterium massiliense]|uniref:TetR/AcrR family transcriptional regulator n=1 Tax=Gorillibacterium massiliense TaxID=1280390 RepID=UPI0004B61ECD|nr:TetR/AcrR family transcriptional regulator [Gorillibacterium massiliense]
MRPEARQQRMQLVINAAEHVFTHKGIEKTTMQDIANQANIGVATVFRFFPKKEKLVVAVATQTLEAVLQSFQSIATMPLSCIQKIGLLFDNFISLLEQKDSSSVKLLENFESYAAQFTEPLEDIGLFNSVYRQISSVFSSIIQQGIQDGSVRPDLPIEKTLTTIMNTFGILARKLSLQKNILVVEPDLNPEEQLAILKHILLSYLSNKDA